MYKSMDTFIMHIRGCRYVDFLCSVCTTDGETIAALQQMIHTCAMPSNPSPPLPRPRLESTRGTRHLQESLHHLLHHSQAHDFKDLIGR